MIIDENYPLKKFNTFNIDVSSKYFAVIKSEADIIEILKDPKYSDENKLVLGGGSNILFTKDYDGLVLKIEIPGIKIIGEDNETVLIKAGGGVIWDDLIKFTVDNGFWGLENLTYIPGTVGAAPIQNIGAYGVEQMDNFHSANVIFLKDASKKAFNKEECKFSYRNSVFKAAYKNKVIVTEVTYKLSKKSVANINYRALASEFTDRDVESISIEEVSEKVRTIRKSKLPEPAKIGNAGSFFKNPEINKFRFERIKNEYKDIVYFVVDDNTIKIPAGWLIEKCGFKGKRFGKTGTFKNQALVLVNHGGATGKEVEKFSKEIQRAVFEKFNINIRPEVNII